MTSAQPQVRHLDLADVEAVGRAVLDGRMEVRDQGLLESALARPRATAFGADAYPALWDTAAALLISLVGNHPLMDGNKRVGFTCAVLFLRKNGVQLGFEEDPAYDLVIAVAEGRLREVPDVAVVLAGWAVPPAGSL